jgi:hypothetical protein
LDRFIRPTFCQVNGPRGVDYKTGQSAHVHE